MTNEESSANEIDPADIDGPFVSAEREEIGRIVQCGVSQGISVHYFSCATDGDEFMFGIGIGATLQEAHKRGCVKCLVNPAL